MANIDKTKTIIMALLSIRPRKQQNVVLPSATNSQKLQIKKSQSGKHSILFRLVVHGGSGIFFGRGWVINFWKEK